MIHDGDLTISKFCCFGPMNRTNVLTIRVNLNHWLAWQLELHDENCKV